MGNWHTVEKDAEVAEVVAEVVAETTGSKVATYAEVVARGVVEIAKIEETSVSTNEEVSVSRMWGETNQIDFWIEIN